MPLNIVMLLLLMHSQQDCALEFFLGIFVYEVLKSTATPANFKRCKLGLRVTAPRGRGEIEPADNIGM